jgi:hypothetical protein
MNDTKLIVKETTVEKEKFTVKKCLSCGSNSIIAINDFEHDFDNSNEKHDGYLCDNCKCFHYIENGLITYEHLYNDIFVENEELNWKITTN